MENFLLKKYKENSCQPRLKWQVGLCAPKVGGGITFIVRGCQFIENKVNKRYGGVLIT